MGLCGNAILPLVYGHFADQYSCVLVTGYLFLALSIWYSLPSKGIKSTPGDKTERKTLKIKKNGKTDYYQWGTNTPYRHRNQ